jgi:hypothetical protein
MKIDKIPEAIRREMTSGNSEDEVRLILTKNKRTIKSNTPFVLFFIENYLNILRENPNLHKSDQMIFLCYATLMAYGNKIKIEQGPIAQMLGLRRETVGRSLKKLIEAELINEDQHGSLTISMAVMLRGGLDSLRNKYADEYEVSAAKLLDRYGDNITLPLSLSDI